ncbi:hypothetical protein Tco_1343156 [Tanacetum coccineum]
MKQPSSSSTIPCLQVNLRLSQLDHEDFDQTNEITYAFNALTFAQGEDTQFEIHKVLDLVDLPYGRSLSGTKWVYRNKKDRRGCGCQTKLDYSTKKFGVYELDALMKSRFQLIPPIETQNPIVKMKTEAVVMFSSHSKDFHLTAVKEFLGKSQNRRWFISCRRLITWAMQKATIVATSTQKKEYVAAANCCGQHNMIANLEKTEGNVEFHEVIDFLQRSYISHALTVSPVVSTTFVEQFWTSAKSKDIINCVMENNCQSSWQGFIGDRMGDSHLYFLFLSCFFLLLMGMLSFMKTFGISFLLENPSSHTKKAKGESEVQRDPLFDVMPEDKIDHMETENAQSEGRTREMVDEDKEFDEDRLSTEDVVSTDKEGVSTDFEKVSTDRPKVSTDESKVSTDEQVEGTEESNESTEEIFEGTEEQREGTEDKVSTDEQMEGTEDQTKEEIASKASQTSTQTPTSMTFGDDETIATLLLNMSKAKAASKEKEKGVELKDVEEIDRPRPTSTRSLLTLKPLPKIDPKDKGKKKIEEEEESESEDDDIPQAVKKFKQLESDEELARKIQEEWEAEEERNKIAEEKATNEALIKNFDDIKARIEADRILAEKLQEQEREQFTIEERAKFLHDTIAAQRKFLARQRSEAIRNRPPTKNQLRNQMMTYLKHVGNFKHSELKSKKFEDIQAMYEKIKRSDEDFIAIGSVEDDKLITKMNKKDSSKEEEINQESKVEVKEEDKGEENTRKRKHSTRKKMKSRKRRFKQDTSKDDPSDTEKENEELRLCLTIAPDEDKEVDYEILDKKYPIIEWKTENLGTKPQFDESKSSEEINMNVVTRSNGQKRFFSTLIGVLSVFDREDLDAVYKLVMNIYQDKIPEGFDKVLWGDLIVMFNPDEQDEFWNSQHEWKVVSWKLHSSSGVHTLMTDEGLVVHMLIEKKYPLKKEIVVQMLNLKLESEEESTMALELIRFIKKVLADLESKEED